MKTVVLTTRLFDRPGNGGELCTERLLRELECAGHRLVVVGRGAAPPQRSGRHHVSVSPGVPAFDTPDRGMRAALALRALLSNQASTVQRLADAGAARRAGEALAAAAAKGVDCLVVDHLQVLGWMNHCGLPLPPPLLVMHNIESEVQLGQALSSSGNPMALARRGFRLREARLLRELEIAALARATSVACLSEADADALRALARATGATPHIAVLPGYPLIEISIPAGGGSSQPSALRRIGMIGTWTWAPNRMALQWTRCLTLCDEPWVWLFGDDDLMPADAVGRAMAAAREEGEGGSLLHFDVQWIDAAGRVSCVDRPFPLRLRARGFAYQRLRFDVQRFASEYVFSRQAFERAGGFVSFPSGWCADDAAWLRLAAPCGIRTLPGSRVGWRHSGLNISSRHGSDAGAKFQALLRYVASLQDFMARHPAAAGEPMDIDILRWVPGWLRRQAGLLGTPKDDVVRARAWLVAQGLPTVGAVARWADAFDAGARRACHALGRWVALGGCSLDGAGPAPVKGQAVPAKGLTMPGAGP